MICQNEIPDLLLNKLENKTVNEERDFTKKTKTECEWKVFNDITKRKKVSGIYKIINKVNGKYYVGSTIHFWNRRRQHQLSLLSGLHHNPHLQNSWNKYGKENFIFRVIEKVPKEKLIEVEQKYLDIAKMETNKCYNQNFLADRLVFTNEIRKKISDKLKGKIVSKNTRKKISITNKKIMGEMRERFMDKNIHKFYNESTGESFTGTSFHFRLKYNLSVYSVRKLVRGIRKHCGGKKQWLLLTPTTNKHH